VAEVAEAVNRGGRAGDNASRYEAQPPSLGLAGIFSRGAPPTFPDETRVPGQPQRDRAGVWDAVSYGEFTEMLPPGTLLYRGFSGNDDSVRLYGNRANEPFYFMKANGPNDCCPSPVQDYAGRRGCTMCYRTLRPVPLLKIRRNFVGMVETALMHSALFANYPPVCTDQRRWPFKSSMDGQTVLRNSEPPCDFAYTRNLCAHLSSNFRLMGYDADQLPWDTAPNARGRPGQDFHPEVVICGPLGGTLEM